jgi:hypothetical protein
MYSRKPVSTQFRLSSILWTGSLLAIMINYTLEVGENISTWQLLMLLITGLSSIAVISLALLSFVLDPSSGIISYLKTIILVLCGPLLFCLSGFAFFEEVELQISIYILSYLSWSLFFSVSIYCSFKLTLEISLFLNKRQKRNKLVMNNEQISLRTVRQ